ncbi:DUF4926 domain-containing protein [candidate division KSB1 bacterium]|nr:MAG: DUF4926 domain-containing protein [candidate division KSB1 bacterium]MBC6946880.1 DUF4926 domain-containing protein [candidate division KSB1 bacterium]MCE7941324.1 DUF4926 domain-containing protein [Chlorobi bacterium CHB1]MDL1873927.1 DUF4926 domain-containing protein [Cytophagia bacterium CHB2]
MIKELDLVVLNHDIAGYPLTGGDIGTVVNCYKDNAAFEVEFLTAEGKTVALLTVTADEIRPRLSSEILHAREVESASV